MVTFKKLEDGSVQPYLEESDHVQMPRRPQDGDEPSATHGEGWSGEHTYGPLPTPEKAEIDRLRAEATAAWDRCEKYRVALEELLDFYAVRTISGVRVASDEQYPHIAKAMRVLKGEE